MQDHPGLRIQEVELNGLAWVVEVPVHIHHDPEAYVLKGHTGADIQAEEHIPNRVADEPRKGRCQSVRKAVGFRNDVFALSLAAGKPCNDEQLGPVAVECKDPQY